jgi:hypothetical protein
MKRMILLSSSAVAVAAAGSLVLGGSAATATSSTHHLHLHATVLKSVETSATTVVETDRLRRHGTTVGFETQSCNDGGQGVKCSVSFALTNGMLLGHTASAITTSNHGTFHGTITGGLGTYTGSKGTVKGHVDGIHASLVITYKH